MTTKTLNPQLLRKRRFLLLLPLLALPFITLMFWALAGGKSSAAQDQTVKAGLNLQLPDASLQEEEGLTKLSYYEKADADSARLEELMKTDPYYLGYKGAQQESFFPGRDTTLRLLRDQRPYPEGSLSSSPYRSGAYTDPNEARVYQKLEELGTALNAPAETRLPKTPYKEKDPLQSPSMSSADIDRLERMMEGSKRVAGEEDGELAQLNEMMEKIMDIQHPERVKQQMSKVSPTPKGQLFAVQASSGAVHPTLLQNKEQGTVSDSFPLQPTPASGFFSLEEEGETTEQANAIRAAIHETQTILDGSIVKFRFLEDVQVGSLLIPKGSFLFGKATLEGERLQVKINSIRHKAFVLPVQLTVIDLDGMEGIHVPGSLTREVVGSSTDRVIQSIGPTTLDPTLKAQAAGAGIEAARTLLNKKTKSAKVTLKGGYQVLLMDEKTKS